MCFSCCTFNAARAGWTARTELILRLAVAPAGWLLVFALSGGACAARGSSGPLSSITPASASQQSANPAPASEQSSARTIEAADARLAAALAAGRSAETPEALLRVAAEYSRLGVFDLAINNLTRGLAISPRNDRLLAARARAWRDWGQPEVALGDAHRAAFFAPASADAHNTLGTIQFALSQTTNAKSSFERALTLAQEAPWVLSNLCYVALIEGDAESALSRCNAALDKDPASTAARNNLALVHAAAGRLDEARATFLASADRPAGHYNMGIVLMARRDYTAAAQAFGEACRTRPAFEAACRRAIEARTLASRSAGR